LRASHPLGKRLADIDSVSSNIEEFGKLCFTPDTLIYVETRNTAGGELEVVSFGHSFRYRWRFRDTVRKGKDGQDRPNLRPKPSEQVQGEAQHVAPGKLTGARLLFGYVNAEGQPGTEAIGKGDFAQLSGRVAFNMAVETFCADRDGKRFVNEGTGSEVLLKILGSPKPSAYEHYISQGRDGSAKRKDCATFLTYGDLLDDPESDLAGRKFYYHQPQAATNSSLYQRKAGDSGNDALASVGRFVSTPGTEFRCLLRFRDLRAWELGAILCALQPQRLASSPSESRNNAQIGTYALKLGVGRPLGLGSVTVSLDGGTLYNAHYQPQAASVADSAQSWVDAFKKKINGRPSIQNTIKNWLAIHRFDNAGPRAYPVREVTKKDGSKETTIPSFYQKYRTDHAKNRRMKK
jgi:CRISPR-associated protein (TIGR03986 family)